MAKSGKPDLAGRVSKGEGGRKSARDAFPNAIHGPLVLRDAAYSGSSA